MRLLVAAPLAALILIAGCASEVRRSTAELTVPNGQPQKKVVCASAVSLMLDSGYERRIAAGTEFLEIGRVQEGSVLKPTTTTFTVEGAHMHEAYPVVASNRIVGFYLPVEHAFSPLSQSVVITLQERNP